MPNWCVNDLFVTGKPEDVEAFVKAARGIDHNDGEGAEENPLCFDNFIPYPQNFRDLDAASEKRRKEVQAMPEEEQAKLTMEERWPKDGYNQGGYEWCVANWGTKWPACHTREVKMIPGKRTAKAVIGFDTAWSPPLQVVLKASETHPKVKLTLKYWEGGMGFKGVYACKGGEVVSESEGPYRGNRG